MFPGKGAWTLVLFGVLLFSWRPLAAQENCFRQDLKIQPKWISTLEFDRSTREVLISDPKSGELLTYNTGNAKMQRVQVGDDVPPSSITKIQGGYLVKYRDDALIIGSDKRPLREKIDLRSTKAGGPTGLGSLYSNWVTQGPTFVGFGSVANFNLGSTQYDPSRGFELGFVTGQVTAASGQFTNVRLLEATEENDFYLLGFPYFAANDQGLFFVKMIGSRASIVQVMKGSSRGPWPRELAAFPNAFRGIPNLKGEGGKILGNAVDLFERIEKEQFAVGLFGDKDLLYLLTRRPDREGKGTEWLLHQIDPARPEPLDEVRLPTRANHLSIAVGEDFWYLFERGAVRGWGDQDIRNVVKVPSRWITSPATSPLSAGYVQCVRQQVPVRK